MARPSKSENKHFCLEFTAYPSRSDHANRPCNPKTGDKAMFNGEVFLSNTSFFIRTIVLIWKVLNWIEAGPQINSTTIHTDYLCARAVRLPVCFCTFVNRNHGKQRKPSPKRWGLRRPKTCSEYEWVWMDANCTLSLQSQSDGTQSSVTLEGIQVETIQA